METFKEIFNNYVDKKTNRDVKIITELCLKLDIDSKIWFKHYIKEEGGYQTGSDILTELMTNFTWYMTQEFDKCIMKYIEPDGKSILGTPYIHTEYELKYSHKNGFFMKDGKSFSKIRKRLSLAQREELMKNKLFYFIVNETKLKIYSKKDIRYLKLKNLNECYSVSK